MIRTQEFIILLLLLILGIDGRSQSISSDSVEVVYDTIFAPDTIRQTEEVIVYETEEYELDLSVGASLGFVQPIVRLQADSAMSNRNALGWTAELPFRANFRPWLIETGLSIQHVVTSRGLSLWTPQSETFHKTIIDTLDVYYVTRNGVRSERAVTRRRDSVWTQTKQIKTDTQSVASYTWLSFPLLIGYQKDFKRFSLAASAGAFTSFLVSVGNGNWQSNGKKLIAETTKDLRRWSVSPAIQFTAILPVSERCDIALASYFLFSPQNQFTSQNYSLQIKQFAVKIAFFYHF